MIVRRVVTVHTFPATKKTGSALRYDRIMSSKVNERKVTQNPACGGKTRTFKPESAFITFRTIKMGMC